MAGIAEVVVLGVLGFLALELWRASRRGVSSPSEAVFVDLSLGLVAVLVVVLGMRVCAAVVFG